MWFYHKTRKFNRQNCKMGNNLCAKLIQLFFELHPVYAVGQALPSIIDEQLEARICNSPFHANACAFGRGIRE